MDLTRKAQRSLQPRHSMSLSAVCSGKLSWDLGLESHPKKWRRPGSNPRPLVKKASSLITTQRRLLRNISKIAFIKEAKNKDAVLTVSCADYSVP